MSHLEGKLFKSRRCLLLVRRDYIGSSVFTIYELRKGFSVRSIKYLVDTDDFMSPLPKGWSIRSIVWSIVWEKGKRILFWSSTYLERGWKGVKERDLNRNKINTALGIGVSTKSEDTMNEDTPVGVASAVKEGVTPYVVNMTVEMEKMSSLEDTTVMGSFLPLSTPVTTTAGNAPGKYSYANITGKPNGKKLNIHTLFTPRGNGIDLVVSVESIRAISEHFGLDAMLENGSWFIRNHPLILRKWHPDKNLLKEDVITILVWVKLHGVPVTTFGEDGLSAIATKLGTHLMLDSYTSDMCMQSWGRSSYARVMFELRADVEFKKTLSWLCLKLLGRAIIYVMSVLSAGEKKTLKNSQTSRGVSVGPKMGFKLQKEYKPVPKRPLLALAVPMGGTTNLVNNEATSSGSSFMNVDNNSIDTTHIIDKIGKFEELITSGQAILVDEAGNPLKKVEFPGDYDSEDEVASVDNDIARSMASERVGFGTQSFLEQWKDSYGNGNNDEDPYDDDMYEGHDLPQELQAIYANLDIRVRGREKK
uniref:Uncharacterized protein n=1 Tax=Tanacetum cinerariifolium TaxID=118510 RepID=A0A699HE24_TANCI|nr:hypothetical protein [Tanacetum cinerariifolium]